MIERPSPMRVAVAYGEEAFRIEEHPIPMIGAGELLIKTEVCGVTGCDLEDPREASMGCVLGRETAGRVARVGSGVEVFQEGDRVFVSSGVPCRRCPDCRRGRDALCRHLRQSAIEPGGFAEYFRVPAASVQHGTLSLPAAVSLEVGALLEPLARVLCGVEAVAIRPGDTVAVIGLGFLGMTYLKVVARTPASRLIGADYSGWRRRRARHSGAHVVIDPRTEPARDIVFALNDGRGADVVIVTTPFKSDWELGLELCGKGGRLHLATAPRPDWRWSVSPAKLYADGLRLTAGSLAAPSDLQAALDLVVHARLDLSDLITHRFGLAEVEAAFQLEQAADASLKAVVYPAINHITTAEVLYDAVI